MKLFRTKSEPLKINYLELTPVRVAEFEQNEDKVIILIPKFETPVFRKILIPPHKKENIHIKLDEIGSTLWLLIDGETKVSDLCSTMNEKFQEKIQPVEERVTYFLTQLYDNKYIKFKEVATRS